MLKENMIKLEIVSNINGEKFEPAYFEKFGALDAFVRGYIKRVIHGDDLCFIASSPSGIGFLDGYFKEPIKFLPNSKLVGMFLNQYADSYKSFKWEQILCQS